MIQRLLNSSLFLMFILLSNLAVAQPAGNQLTVLKKAFSELNTSDFDVAWYADAGKYVVGFDATKLNRILSGYGEHVAVDGRTKIKLKQFQVDADGDFRITSHLRVLYTSGGFIKLKAKGSGSQTTHIFARIENGKLFLHDYRLSHVEIKNAPAAVDDYAQKQFKKALKSSAINVEKSIPAIRIPEGVYMLRYEQTVKIPSRKAHYLYMVFEDPAAPIIVETSEPDMVEMVRLGMAKLNDNDFHQTISGGVYKVGVNIKKLNEIVSTFGTQLVMDGQRNTKPTVKMYDFSIGVHENSLKVANKTRIIWKGYRGGETAPFVAIFCSPKSIKRKLFASSPASHRRGATPSFRMWGWNGAAAPTRILSILSTKASPTDTSSTPPPWAHGGKNWTPASS